MSSHAPPCWHVSPCNPPMEGRGVRLSDRAAPSRGSMLATCWHVARPRWGVGLGRASKLMPLCDPPWWRARPSRMPRDWWDLSSCHVSCHVLCRDLIWWSTGSDHTPLAPRIFASHVPRSGHGSYFRCTILSGGKKPSPLVGIVWFVWACHVNRRCLVGRTALRY
jgi:hypothetical protein